MYSGKLDHDLFYSVQPGDSLWKIANNQFGLGIAKETKKEVDRIMSINSHIKDPNRIFPGDLLLLGSPGRTRTDRSVYPQDLVEMQGVWKKTSAETKESIRRNFDLLDWLSSRGDEVDFLRSSAEETVSIWKSVQPYRTVVQEAQLMKLSAVFEELVVVRNQTISLLARYRLSVSRIPIFLVSIESNGLYSYARKLVRMVELAEKFRVGRVLLAADILLEAATVARVGIETRDVGATTRQGVKSAGKILGGIGGGVVAKYGCRTLIQIHKIYGSIGCVVLVGVGIWGGKTLGEVGGDFTADFIQRRRLDSLP